MLQSKLLETVSNSVHEFNEKVDSIHSNLLIHLFTILFCWGKLFESNR